MTSEAKQLRQGIVAATDDLVNIYNTLVTNRILCAAKGDKQNALRYELAAADVKEIRERLTRLLEVAPDVAAIAEKKGECE